MCGRQHVLRCLQGRENGGRLLSTTTDTAITTGTNGAVPERTGVLWPHLAVTNPRRASWVPQCTKWYLKSCIIG